MSNQLTPLPRQFWGAEMHVSRFRARRVTKKEIQLYVLVGPMKPIFTAPNKSRGLYREIDGEGHTEAPIFLEQ